MTLRESISVYSADTDDVGASQWRACNDLALKQDDERHVAEQDMAVSTDTKTHTTYSRQTGVSRHTVHIYRVSQEERTILREGVP
jgi:hypothetical protein